MKESNLNIIIANDYDDLSIRAAKIMADEIKKKPSGNFGFATGSTPIGMYKHMIQLHKNGELDFKTLNTFNLDEYYPIKKSNEQSYDFFMKSMLFNQTNINFSNVFLPNGETTNPELECAEYDKKIMEYGGLEMQLLGIGPNGHIGFNEPDEAFSQATNLVELTKSTIEANKRFFENEEDVPKKALTMGIKTIMMANKILLIISGKSKADIALLSLKGPITPKVPASILQLHQNVTVVLDKDAASKL